MTDTETRRIADEIEPLVREIAPALLAYFSRRVRPTEEAADCLSETLLTLWRRRADLPEDRDGQRAWAFGIARRVLANVRRGAVRRIALSDRLRESLEQWHGQNADRDDVVAEALATLKESERELVTLILWDGFGVAEAGAVLGLKPATARTRYARAKARLRDAIGEA